MSSTASLSSRRNLKSEVAQHLREAIFSGELVPGSRVDQDGLAKQLGVSKLPVREAVLTLESEGLIIAEPRRGAFVASLTRDDIRDHFRIFGAVAALAAESAATDLSDGDLDELEAAIVEMEAGGSFERLRELNSAFHRGINRAGSRRIRTTLRVLARTMPSRFYEFAAGWEESAHREHREILEALRAGDQERAAAATIAHFQRNGDLAVSLLEESGFWSDEPMDTASGDSGT